MYESKLLSLIQEGENETVEFKREVNFDAADGKAEFVKDVISLANSAPERGYLLIGVDNNKQIVGIQKLEEERIQQINSAYIAPPVVLRCSTILVQTPSSLLIGVIEIRGKNKPHKVVRSIEKLNQNEVFVRHGSVVSRASPEEIIDLDHTSRLETERKQFIRSAEAHASINELPNAINAYSKAIEIMPTSDTLLARGKLYAQQMRAESITWKEKEEIAHQAIKDFTNVLILTDSKDTEKESRLERFRACCHMGSGFVDEIWEQDLDWLEANTAGREVGEVMYLKCEGINNEVGLRHMLGQATVTLDKAILLGYDGPDVRWLRAKLHSLTGNYGLVLQDVEQALSSLGIPKNRKHDLLFLQTDALIRQI